MKIALLQTNPVVGDFQGNIAKMAEGLDRARRHGCTMAIFPELAISGYPPMDLLERPSFYQDHAVFLNHFASLCGSMHVVVGIIERHTGVSGYPLHNSAALVCNGKIVFTAQKRLLPTYDVFDERRYFEPGAKSRIFQLDGTTFAFTVCEDIWNEGEGLPRRLYDVDPVDELLEGSRPRPDLLINIAASPFHCDKGKLREGIFTALCRKHRIPLLYVNQVGGQDSLIFDGHSLAINSRGEIIGRGAMFGEDMLTVLWQNNDILPTDESRTEAHYREPEEQLFQALCLGTRDYVTKCGFDHVVVGLSGGIDSALTATVSAAALGADKVLGVAMPSPYSSRESVEDAEQLANNLAIEFAVLPIDDIFAAFGNTLAPLFGDFGIGIAEQNIQARIRGTLLMALANRDNRLLLSTGNKSEMAVGYCTLYGDMNGGLAVISDLPKQLVYKVASYCNRERTIIPERTFSKAPSAELAPHQKDQDDLPPYDILDAIVTLYLENNESPSRICERGFAEQTVHDVVRRIKRNEYKRKQAPPGLRVTSKAFGIGRRYPTAERYVEQS